VYMYLLFSGVNLDQDEPWLEGNIIPTQCTGTGRARTMCTCLLCLVEYSLNQDEPWLEGTIIPNTHLIAPGKDERGRCAHVFSV
jgi:hypothetical protein